MPRFGSIVLCAALALPTLLGGCAAPLALQALATMPGATSQMPAATGQSLPFSLDALTRQLDSMTRGQVAQAPQ